MEVKIGVLHTPREIVVESTQTPDEVEALVATALKSVDGQLSLTDERGRRVIVPGQPDRLRRDRAGRHAAASASSPADR